MKHIYGVITYGWVAAMLFAVASCDKSSSPAPSENCHSIAFGTPYLTKAVIESSEDMDAFTVWGGTDAADATNVFNATRVYKNGNIWDYDYPRYWVEGKSYRFIAVYPDAGINAVCSKDGVVSIENFDCSMYGEEATDLMVATATRDYDGTNSEAVGLVFRHLLARVNISAKSSGHNVTVKEISLYGVNYKGSYVSSSPDDIWSGIAVADESSGLFKSSGINLTSSLESVNIFENLLLIPHYSLDNAVLKLKYSYYGETKEYESIISMRTAAVDEWLAGQMYDYTVTIPLNLSGIVLDVTVKEWEEENTSVSWGN